jgi:hypothetical protein
MNGHLHDRLLVHDNDTLNNLKWIHNICPQTQCGNSDP